MVFLSSYQNYM